MVICVDEFGPSTSSRTLAGSGPARPVGRPDAAASAASDLYPPAWPAHLLAAYDLSRDRLYGHIKPRKRRGEFLVFRISIWAAANNVE